MLTTKEKCVFGHIWTEDTVKAAETLATLKRNYWTSDDLNAQTEKICVAEQRLRKLMVRDYNKYGNPGDLYVWGEIPLETMVFNANLCL